MYLDLVRVARILSVRSSDRGWLLVWHISILDFFFFPDSCLTYRTCVDEHFLTALQPSSCNKLCMYARLTLANPPREGFRCDRHHLHDAFTIPAYPTTAPHTCPSRASQYVVHDVTLVVNFACLNRDFCLMCTNTGCMRIDFGCDFWSFLNRLQLAYQSENAWSHSWLVLGHSLRSATSSICTMLHRR